MLPLTACIGTSSHRDTGAHPTASLSSSYPLSHEPANVSRTARAQTASSHCASSRAGCFCSIERKLPLASVVVPMWSHSSPTGTPFSTRANRFDVAVRLQLDVPGVLNVQPSPMLAATVLRSCVNRFARCPAGLLAYQVADATSHQFVNRCMKERSLHPPIPAEMKAVSPGQLVSAIP